jgi:hypothetical protein
MFWHHDVGLSFPKSVGALIGGSADLFKRHFIWARGLGTIMQQNLYFY